MVNEIRELGDNRTVVLYTDERKIANQVSSWDKCFKRVPYYQYQKEAGKEVLVGIDLYVNKRYEKRLLKTIGSPKPKSFTHKKKR